MIRRKASLITSSHRHQTYLPPPRGNDLTGALPPLLPLLPEELRVPLLLLLLLGLLLRSKDRVGLEDDSL